MHRESKSKKIKNKNQLHGTDIDIQCNQKELFTSSEMCVGLFRKHDPYGFHRKEVW